jgi:NAD-dependent DNA ligase
MSTFAGDRQLDTLRSERDKAVRDLDDMRRKAVEWQDRYGQERALRVKAEECNAHYTYQANMCSIRNLQLSEKRLRDELNAAKSNHARELSGLEARLRVANGACDAAEERARVAEARVLTMQSDAACFASFRPMPIPARRPLSGKSFCITGTLNKDRYKVRSDLIRAGATVHDRVKTSTTYLVVGTKPGGTKLADARRFGTRQLTEAQLERMMP